MNGFSQNINWIKSYSTDTGSQCIGKDVKSAYHSNATYVCGFDYNTKTVAGLPFTSGPNQGYFMKIKENGDTAWLKHTTSNTTGPGSVFVPTAGAVDTKDNFYAVGWYTRYNLSDKFFLNNLTFATGSAFIIKFDSSGKILWSKDILTGYCNFDDIDIDMYGNIYIMGNTRLQQVFGTDTVRKPTSQAGSNFSRDFIVSYDSSGNVRWAKGYGEVDLNATSGTTDRGGFFSLVVEKSPTMNIYTCGLFHASYTYQNQTLTSPANENGMLLKLDSLGRHIKNLVIIDTSGKSILTSIAINESGSIALGGSFTVSAVINGVVHYTGSSVSYFFSPFIANLDTSLTYKWVHQAAGLSYPAITAINKDGKCAFYQTTGSTTGGYTRFTYLELIDSSGNVEFTKKASYPFVSSFTTAMYPTAVTFSNLNSDRVYCIGQYKPRLTVDSTITIVCRDTVYVEVVLINIEVPPTDTCKPKLNIGADTLYCANFSRTLDAAIPNAKYVWWHNGTVVDTTKTIVANTAGLYKVSITKTGCSNSFSDSISLDQKSIPAKVNLGVDTIGCNVDSVVLYSPNTTDQLIWNNKVTDTARTYTVKKTGNYWLKAYNFCGSSADTIRVEINVTPTFTLGDDTTYCSAFTRVLKPASLKGSNYNFLWSTAQTAGAITINSAGSYWCKVSNVCGAGIDTVHIMQTVKPKVSLGPDIQACDVSFILLTANNITDNIEWNSVASDTQQVYIVNQPGNYWLKAYNACGTDYDTVAVKFGKTPYANLGNDTTICNASQLVLEAGATGDKIRWNNSINDTNRIFTVTAKGTYWVKLTNDCGTVTDDIKVDFKTSPMVNLGNDTTLCSGNSLVLTAGNSSNDFEWMGNPALNTQNYIVNKAGIFWLKESNACGADYDSITVTSLSLPVVNLGPDIALKPPVSLTLDAGNPGCKYRWSTSATDTLRYLTAKTVGLYWVDVTNKCGTVRDSLRINLNTTGIYETVSAIAKVYPNPATNTLFIDLGQAPDAAIKIRITDISGKTITEVENQNNTTFGIDVSTLPSGLYFISFTNYENRVFTQKIIIER